jgi:hypothetical protein
LKEKEIKSDASSWKDIAAAPPTRYVVHHQFFLVVIIRELIVHRSIKNKTK